MSSKHRQFVKAIDKKKVSAAIDAAEAGATGEIVLYITHQATIDPTVSAAAFFEKVGLTKLPARNGVLIFVAPESRKFAVYGGPAYHEQTGAAHWQELIELLSRHFRAGDYTGGIVAAIEQIGRKFQEHFPGSGGGHLRNVFEK